MKIKNNKFSIGEHTTARAICNETILFFWDKETSLFFAYVRNSRRGFTAGFLELSTTWFSEKVKWNDALQLSMRIAGERVLTKIVGINYKSF